MKNSARTGVAIISVVAGLAASVHGQCVMEVEPNENKGNATPALLAAGGCLQGNTRGSATTAGAATSMDYWRVQTMPAASGIYRHRLVLSSATPGHSAQIWGTGQVQAELGPWRGVVGVPNASNFGIQDHVLEGTNRIVQWYGFGREEQIYYRVTGATATTEDYVATLETEPVLATNIGTFLAGMLTITTAGQGHFTNTDFWIYDEDLVPIRGYGNDGASPYGGYSGSGTSILSFMRREFPAGTYYLAMAVMDLCLKEGSPTDDHFRNGRLLDFPDAALARDTGPAADVSFAVTDSWGTAPVAAWTGGPQQVAWFTFTVVGDVPVGSCCFLDGSCNEQSEGTCAMEGGVYGGDFTTCASNPCPQPGACCFATGGCSLFLESNCTGLGGVFHGGTTTCAAMCPTPNEVLLPPNFTATGSARWVFTPNYSQMLDVPGNATAFRLSVDALPRTGTSTNQSMQMSLTSPNGTTFVLGGSATGWSGPNHSGTRPSGGASAVSFDGFYLHNFGPIAGMWHVNFENTSNSGTLTWTNIRITPVEMGSGACCLPAGCEVRATDQCLLAEGTFMGVGSECTACGPVLCYANCDQSTVPPILNVDDFTCFINEFAAAQGLTHEQQITSYANCDDSTVAPVLNVDDFTCFINEFAAGCR